MSENKGQEPNFDTSADSDEPAFDWLNPAASSSAGKAKQPGPAQPKGPAAAAGSTSAGGPATSPLPANTSERVEDSSTKPRHEASAATGAAAAKASAAKTGVVPNAPAHSSAATGAAASQGTGSAAGTPAVGSADSSRAAEPFTSSLSIRQPEEQTRRRDAARDAAVNSRPVAPLVIKILSAIFLPLLLAIAAVRAVASPLFLWIEYHRPGFPGDGYGFSTDDRMTFGSYGVDYLSNFSGRRYLADLVNASGDKLFKDGEVSHMADVKTVTMITWGVGAVLLVLAVIGLVYLARRRDGSARHAIFSASVVALASIVVLGVLGALGWEQFFTRFHELFFANGTWTFSLDDTLIRLYPGQFWIDAAATVAALVFLTALVSLILSWPTRRRREASRAAVAARTAAQQEALRQEEEAAA